MAINKVVYGNDTLMDLTNDTVEANNLLEGATAHDRSGQQVQGTARQGHAIEDADGTLLTQRDTMQIKGMRSYDDPTNQKTVIDDTAVEISWADWQDMTEAQRETYLAEHPKVDVVGFPDADADLQLDFMTKLWENPDPTATFAGQDITLANDDYDFLLILHKIHTTLSASSACIVEKGKTAHLETVYIPASSNNVYTRDLTYVSDTSLTATACTRYQIGASQTTANDNVIPLAIYGFKKKITVTVDAIAEDVSTSASKCMLDENTSVADALTWKYFDEITGANSKATPSNFRELLMSVGDGSYNMTFYIPKVELSDTEKAYTCGSWRDANTARLSALVRVSLSSISLVWMYSNGTNETATSKCRIYYR